MISHSGEPKLWLACHSEGKIGIGKGHRTMVPFSYLGRNAQLLLGVFAFWLRSRIDRQKARGVLGQLALSWKGLRIGGTAAGEVYPAPPGEHYYCLSYTATLLNFLPFEFCPLVVTVQLAICRDRNASAGDIVVGFPDVEPQRTVVDLCVRPHV